MNTRLTKEHIDHYQAEGVLVYRGLMSGKEVDTLIADITEAIGRMGTTFSSYRTVWGEPGQYGELLRVYDRAGEPCRRCGTPVRRIVQAARSTFYCPCCQGGRSGPRGTRTRPRPAPRKAR